jgi:hypothetical protein
LTIYPIITYNDFHFGLNGLNVYLNDVFSKSLPSEFAGNLSIAPVVLMNLESLLDMVLTGQGVIDMEQHIHRFFGLATQAQQAVNVTGNKAEFLMAYAGFDELYNWQFAPKPGDNNKTQEVLHQLLKLAGISFEELEQKID